MLKHFFVMIILSMVIIFFQGWAWLNKAFMSLGELYWKMDGMVLSFLPSTPMTHRAVALLLLIVVPLLVVSAVAGVYYLFQKRLMPAFVMCVWSLWSLLIVVLSLTQAH